MKNILIATIATISLLSASELNNYLSSDYNELFDLELQQSFSESKYNSLTWIAPINLTFQRTWNTKVEHSTSPMNSYTISINQPIFKSGGIYYGIKFAKANYELAKTNIIKAKKELIVKAIEILFNIKQTKLNIQKLKLQIKNSNIEIAAKEDLYNAGLASSVDLDNALAKKDEALLSLMNLKESLAQLEGAFRKISNKNPNRLKLPHLRLISKDRYLSSNLEIKSAKEKARVSSYLAKMTRSKYLPTVTLGASYTKLSKAQPFTKKSFANYSLTINLPISINAGNDLENAKLKYLIAKLKVKTTQKDELENYKTIYERLKLINRQIAISNKQAKIYARLLRSTKNLYRAGQRTINDVKLLKNSYKIKRLEAQIYSIKKELELLKLYAKVN